MLLAGCSETGSYPIVRLDRGLAGYSDLAPQARDEMRDSLAVEFAALAALTGDTLSDTMLEAWSGSTAVDFFQPAVDSVFPNLDTVESDLGSFYKTAAKKGIRLPRYRVVAVTWPSYRPMALRDSVVFVALNHYLGSDYEAYSDFEPYQRALKDPARISQDLVSGIIRSAFPYKSTTDRVFERMLYEGAVAYVQMSLLDRARLDFALGFTSGQIDYLSANERNLWREFGLQKGLLYSTDPEVIRSLMDIGARSSFDSGRAPGGLGRYIGYRMVESYLDAHPGTPISYLLTPPFYAYARTLVDSAYNPFD